MPRLRALCAEDTYLLRKVADPRVSADGKRVAFVVAWNEREANERQMAIYVAELEGNGEPQRFSSGCKDHSPRWSPDGQHLAFVGDRGEGSQLFVAALAGGDARQLTDAPHGVSEPEWSPDSKRLAYTARVGKTKDPKFREGLEKAAPLVVTNLRYRLDGVGYFDDRRTHIFNVDLKSGKETQITTGDWFDQQPSWSPNGKLILFTSDRERGRHDRQFRGDVWVIGANGGRARRLTRGRGSAYYPSFSPDGRSVAYIGHEYGNKGSGRNAHILIVPATGGEPRSLSAPLDRNVLTFPACRSYEWQADGQALLFLAIDRGRQSIYRAGVGNGSVSEVVGGERQVLQFALRPGRNEAVIATQWSDSPPELSLANLGGRRAESKVSAVNAELLKEARPQALERISYAGVEGLEIEAFVLRPYGYVKGRRYPLVLDIHGGPHGQHPSLGLSLRMQTLASAGYIVLMPNPRGSSGYGEEFALACVRDWGGKDYEDLMLGVEALVERGLADPERLFVQGYSYGGFMTTWVIGRDHRFKAAIIGAPVADQVSMRGTSDIPMFCDQEVGGTPFDNLDEWRRRSAISYLADVQTPVLIEHHEGDLRCPIGQGEEVFQNLKLLGKEATFVRYPGGFHTLETHLPSQDVDYMERAIAFYARHDRRARGATSTMKQTGVVGAGPAPKRTRTRAGVG